MDFNPINIVPSQRFPGVNYRLNRISYGRRSAFELETGAYRAKLREIRRERKPLDDEYRAALDKAKAGAEPKIQALVDAGTPRAEAEKQVPLGILDFADEKFAAWSELMDAERRVDRDGLGATMIRCAFVGIDGFTLAGKVPTVDELLADGPPELLDELAVACDGVLGMTPDQLGNWQWPGTSERPEAGQTQGISAVPAAKAEAA